MRSLHRNGADQKGFGISQQAFCNAKFAFVRTNALLATMVLVLRSSHIDEAGILQASKQSRLYLIYFPNSLTAGIPAEKDKTAF